MPLVFANQTALTITSSGSLNTNAIWPMDDAAAITVVITSSVVGTTFTPQVSLFDPRTSYTAGSSKFYTLQQPLTTPIVIAPGQAFTIQNPGFQQLRLLASSGVETSGTIVGYAMRVVHL